MPEDVTEFFNFGDGLLQMCLGKRFSSKLGKEWPVFLISIGFDFDAKRRNYST